MYCTTCGNELREEDRYCSRCGKRTASTPAMRASRALRLDKQSRKIAGVCAGFARYLDVDVVLIRVLWMGIALCTGGLGFLAYLAAWIIVPSDYGLETGNLTVHQPQVS